MIFNYLIVVGLSISQILSQFYSLESDNLIYPLKLQHNFGNLESQNIYLYNVNDFGINSSQEDFNIGIWVNPIRNNLDQHIMQINENTINILYGQQLFKIYVQNQFYPFVQNQIQNSWLYVYYQQIVAYGKQQLCYIEIYYDNGQQPKCFQLQQNNYYSFGFLQPAINQYNYFNTNYELSLYPFDGEAISITMKKMRVIEVNNNLQMIDLLTIMTYVEPEVILDLKMYERIQTQILKDWSNYQHIVQLGDSLQQDIYDPLIVVNEQMIQFSTKQYIQIDNFLISKSITIEFQLTSAPIQQELIIFSFISKREQQQRIKISANINSQIIIVSFSQYSQSFSCSIDFQQKLMLGIINLVKMTYIQFIQTDQIKCLSSYFDVFDLTDVDKLFIGSFEKLVMDFTHLINIYKTEFVHILSINVFIAQMVIIYFKGSVLNNAQYIMCQINNFKNVFLNVILHVQIVIKCIQIIVCFVLASELMNQIVNVLLGILMMGFHQIVQVNQQRKLLLEYLPDMTIDSGIFEFQCFTQADKLYQIKFSKIYLSLPYVAITLLGHIDSYFQSPREFQVFLSEVQNTFFFIRVLCFTQDGSYKIQWVAGKSNNFLNVIQTDQQGLFATAILNTSFQNIVSAGILGWCLDSLQYLQIDLNLQQQSSSQFEFTSLQNLYVLKYQFFHFVNYIYYQFNLTFNSEKQFNGFSIGGATITYAVDQFPLSIPTFLSIRRLQTTNSYCPQYYITEKKKPGQIEFKMKTNGSVTVNYFLADLIYLAVSCNDSLKSCDYISELQKCNRILSDCQCSSSQYLDINNNLCIDCSPNCLTCDINYTNCQSCSLESKKQLFLNYFINYYYCGCSITQYEDMNGICQECDPNCNECQMTSKYCLNCKDINQIINQLNQCECRFGYLQTELGCQLCQPPCQTCEFTLTNCLSCQYPIQVIPTCQCPTGYQIVNGNCFQNCPLLCLNCVIETSCITCVSFSSYNALSNVCECCVYPCVNCISLNQCTQCIDQTYYIDITCQLCIYPCLECTTSSYCLSCINYYYLSNNQCLLCIPPCLTCNDLTVCNSCIDNTYYHDQSTNQCILCISPCLTCETDVYCSTCINTNYYLSSANTCLNCVNQCKNCLSETQCIDCILGYYIDINLACQPCISPCIYCSTIDICDLCSDGYFLDTTFQCQPCLKPCLTCINTQSSCLSCIDSTMTQSNGSCICASNQFYDSLTSICKNCHPTCTSCSNPDNCCSTILYSQFNISTNTCECQNGYYQLSLNTCLLCVSPCLYCSSQSVCTSCVDGYYLSSSSSSQSSCLTCTSPCLNCINTSTQCLSCVSINMVIINQTCTCPSNYYMNSTLTDCIQCHSTCLTCTNSNDCCLITEFKIFDSVSNNCRCKNGYFDSNGICQQCNQNCLTCEKTSTNCLSCDIKFKLEAQECKCILPNQFINHDLGLCENCSSNCQTCSMNANNCLSCDETKKFQLIKGVCSCKTNEYQNNNGICTECHKSCVSCVNGSEIGCLGCISLRKMNPENKLCECTDGYFQNDNQECVKCNHKCGKCTYNNQCLTCSENRSLSQDGFSCNCNQGFFENEKEICLKCSPPCFNCSSIQDCLSCIDVNREVKEYRCQCQKGYFETEQNQCESCSSIRGKVNDICNYINCGDGELTKGEQCDDGNNISRDGCTDCKIDQFFTCTNKMLSRSICFQCVMNCQTCSLKGLKGSCDQCYNGYFFKNDECLKCQDSCETCKDNKTCLTCTIIDAKPDELGLCPKCTNVKGYYIINRKCITKCGDAILVESEQCDDGNNLDGDGCDSQCQIEKYYSCKETICTKIPQPQVDATYTNSTTSESIALNFPIDQGDPCTKINITIDSFLSNDFLSFIKYEQIDDNISKCNIDFQFNKTIDVGNLIHIFIPVKIRTSKRILEEETREIIITPRKKVIYSQNQVQLAQSASNAQSAFGDMLYFIAPTTVIIGGFNFFWTILDILSWINNLYYINIYFPENVRIFFQKSAWGDFQIFPQFFVLNEPQDPYYIESPKKFMEKGVDPIFLNNTWTCFAIIAINIIGQIFCYLILLLIEFIWPPALKKRSSQIRVFQLKQNSQTNSFNLNTQNKFTKIKKQQQPQSQIINTLNQTNDQNMNQNQRFPYLINKIYQPLYKFKSNFLSNLIKSFNLAFLDLVLAIILQITTIPNSLMVYEIVFINQILSYASISICIITLIISYYVTTKHYILLDHELFQNQYGTLYENINTKSSTAMMYSYINLNRKALFIIVVVYFYYQPLLQTIFCCFISFLNIALIIYENPFTSKADLIQNGVPDFCIFILMLLSTGFALDDIIGLLSADQRFQIGWVMIGTIGLSIFVQVVFLLREFIRDFQEKFLMISQKIQICLQSQKNQ
ncbi:unnamed protein product [Paramecium sonneborni]|uniref:EGF-like domain-containing protein n=1 Tax=Paramecium sonneborni TaxID=65129 RepID=A0A8S1ML23_9CILI|nr:unnamed protein product [Paramecium sonneborni]